MARGSGPERLPGDAAAGAGEEASGSAGAGWPPLPPGGALTVVKLAPDGREAARYPATVVAPPAAPWLAADAVWTAAEVALDGLRLVPGDRLREYFSPHHRFNAFAVFAPDGRLRGWYANVAHPTRLDPGTDPPTLAWHDLWVDVVARSDDAPVVRDEDELAASGLLDRDPALHAAIGAARDEILALLARRAIPFHDR